MTIESIALNRFGLGARPAEPMPADPRRWLLDQLDGYEPVPPSWRAFPRAGVLVQTWAEQQRAVRQAPENQRSGIREAYLRKGREVHLAAVGARATSSLQTSTPFVERLVHFWANHFAVSVDKLQLIGLAGSLEADAIRPHVLGRFEDMLLAAVRHPAMLLYLDQARSTGPNSQAGRRSARRTNPQGLNENLAREILELHTLGVRSGYTQDDVTELARALTGWTVPGEESLDGEASGFRFVPAMHEPGIRKVLGRSYPEEGEAQARAILHDLSTSPSTARHLATKLACHFVSDEAPEALVRQLTLTWLRSGGDLAAVYRALLLAPETWAAGGGKFKSPWDWTVSGLRALGRKELPANQVNNLLNQLGQPVWKPGSPAGYGDIQTAWAAPDALLRRVEVAARLAAQLGATIDARELAPRVLPGALGERTRKAIASSDSPATALALLLASPEFMRR